jgi:hypothetical protein
MARELEFALEALDALEETHQAKEGGGRSVEIAIVTNVRKDGTGGGLTVTKRNLTFQDGLLVGQGKDYQVRIDTPSAFR